VIEKSFDEMTGNGQALTSEVLIYKAGNNFIGVKQTITAYFAIVVGEDFRQAWLVANGRLNERSFKGESIVPALVDGERYKFEGHVQDADREWSGDYLMHIEKYRVGVTEDFLRAVANSSSSKVRLAGLDLELPADLVRDVQELISAI
jgi:hypothetical protein